MKIKVFYALSDNIFKSINRSYKMSTLKDILTHVCIETAKAKRTCKGKNKHVDKTIPAGNKCLKVRTGRFSSSTYCIDCANTMLKRASEKIILLQKEMAGS